MKYDGFRLKLNSYWHSIFLSTAAQSAGVHEGASISQCKHQRRRGEDMRASGHQAVASQLSRTASPAHQPSTRFAGMWSSVVDPQINFCEKNVDDWLWELSSKHGWQTWGHLTTSKRLNDRMPNRQLEDRGRLQRSGWRQEGDVAPQRCRRAQAPSGEGGLIVMEIIPTKPRVWPESVPRLHRRNFVGLLRWKILPKLLCEKQLKMWFMSVEDPKKLTNWKKIRKKSCHELCNQIHDAPELDLLSQPTATPRPEINFAGGTR